MVGKGRGRTGLFQKGPFLIIKGRSILESNGDERLRKGRGRMVPATSDDDKRRDQFLSFAYPDICKIGFT